MEHIHVYANPTVKWQIRYANALRAGALRFGYRVEVRSRHNARLSVDVLNIVLGPNYWHSVQQECRERSLNYLMVNRAFWGDPDYVSIGWNGFNGHADFVTEHADGSRWERTKPRDVAEQRKVDAWGHAWVFGQVSAHTTAWASVQAWQRHAAAELDREWPGMRVEHRLHPAHGGNAQRLEDVVEHCDLAVTLNTTAVVACVIAGVPVVAQDVGNIAWAYYPEQVARANWQPSDAERQLFLHRLAWSQWALAEIPEGQWLAHLTQRLPCVAPMPVFGA